MNAAVKTANNGGGDQEHQQQAPQNNNTGDSTGGGSGNTQNIGAFAFPITIIAIEAAEPAAAFSSAAFTLTTTPTGRINETTFAATAAVASKDFTISSDVTAVSVDVSSSSDVLGFTNSGIITAVTSASVSNDKFTLIVDTTSGTTGSVTFKISSGDNESVDIILNFTAVSDKPPTPQTLNEVVDTEVSADNTYAGIP